MGSSASALHWGRAGTDGRCLFSGPVSIHTSAPVTIGSSSPVSIGPSASAAEIPIVMSVQSYAVENLLT